LKIHQVDPAGNPRVKALPLRCFHDLEAAQTSGLDPACEIFHLVWHHSPVSPKAFAYGLDVSVPEVLNHHEEHAPSVSFRALRQWCAVKASIKARSIAARGADSPVQISNCAVACSRNISTPAIISAPCSAARFK